jgi:hypothetical protein
VVGQAHGQGAHRESLVLIAPAVGKTLGLATYKFEVSWTRNWGSTTPAFRSVAMRVVPIGWSPRHGLNVGLDRPGGLLSAKAVRRRSPLVGGP